MRVWLCAPIHCAPKAEHGESFLKALSKAIKEVCSFLSSLSLSIWRGVREHNPKDPPPQRRGGICN